MKHDVFKKLYKRGYVDFVLGNAETSVAPVVGGSGGFGSGVLDVGTYRVGIRWNQHEGKWEQSASLSTRILCK